MNECLIAGCGRPKKTRGYCGTHYMRWLKHGDPYHVESSFGRRRPRPVKIVGAECHIPLNNGLFAVTDAEFADRVGVLTWYARRTPNVTYAVSENPSAPGVRRRVWLHRLVSAAPDGSFIDHINGDGLDCRRSNLRIATNSQNQANTGLRSDNKTGFKGVFRDGKTGRYVAVIRVRGTRRRLGSFCTPEDAQRAYAAAAQQAFGEFARITQ